MLKCIWAVRYFDCVNFYLQTLSSVSSRCHVYLLLCLVSVLCQYFQPFQEYCQKLTSYYMPFVRVKKIFMTNCSQITTYVVENKNILNSCNVDIFWTLNLDIKWRVKLQKYLLKMAIMNDLHWSDYLQLPLGWLILLPLHQWKIVYYRCILDEYFAVL